MTFYVTPMHRAARRRFSRADWPQNGEQETAPTADVFAPINVRADGDDYVITALLPGIKAEDISIQVVDEIVTIQGQLPAEEGVEYLVREIPTGKFYRSIRLAEPLDSNAASADLTNGVLTVRVPKAEAVRPHTIKVNAA